MASHKIKINRAPVLTLWASVVAQRMVYERAEALTLARAVAGLNAQSKGRRLGIYEPPEPQAESETEADGKNKEPKPNPTRQPETVTVLGRAVPVKRTKDGLRATLKDQPIDPAGVERYLRSKFGDALPKVQQAMTMLADAYTPEQLATKAYELYEAFRPDIPEGVKGWGAAGVLDLRRVADLAEHST